MKKWVDKKELARAIRIFGVRVLLIDLKEAKVGKHQVLYKKDWIVKQKDISYRFVKKLKNNKKWKQ